jgi:hypothetical protein
MPSQGNLNIAYTCDHYRDLLDPLKGSFGEYSLVENYAELITSSTDQYNLANLILSTIENPNEDLLNEIIDLSNLSSNEMALLKFNFYYRNENFTAARYHLMLFKATNPDEADYKYLRLLDLDVIENGWEVLTNANLHQLEMIRNKESYNSNMAVSILNNTSTYRDYFEQEIDLPEVEKSEQDKYIGENESYLNIYPNPATDKVFIELINNTGAIGNLYVYDVSGKKITEYTTTLVAGGIEMDIQHLNKGFYFVTFTNSDSGLKLIGKLLKSGTR